MSYQALSRDVNLSWTKCEWNSSWRSLISVTTFAPLAGGKESESFFKFQRFLFIWEWSFEVHFCVRIRSYSSVTNCFLSNLLSVATIFEVFWRVFQLVGPFSTVISFFGFKSCTSLRATVLYDFKMVIINGIFLLQVW